MEDNPDPKEKQAHSHHQNKTKKVYSFSNVPLCSKEDCNQGADFHEPFCYRLSTRTHSGTYSADQQKFGVYRFENSTSFSDFPIRSKVRAYRIHGHIPQAAPKRTDHPPGMPLEFRRDQAHFEVPAQKPIGFYIQGQGFKAIDPYPVDFSGKRQGKGQRFVLGIAHGDLANPFPGQPNKSRIRNVQEEKVRNSVSTRESKKDGFQAVAFHIENNPAGATVPKETLQFLAALEGVVDRFQATRVLADVDFNSLPWRNFFDLGDRIDSVADDQHRAIIGHKRSGRKGSKISLILIDTFPSKRILHHFYSGCRFMASGAAEIAELVLISQYGAGDLLLSQGGGGNTSVKSPDGRTMWIKASGISLSRVAPDRGFVPVDLPSFLDLLRHPDRPSEEKSRRMVGMFASQGAARPSMEIGFHAVLPRVVLHTHAVYVNAYACMAGGESLLARTFDEPFLWVPYHTPGDDLAIAVDRVYPADAPRAIVLENHGLIAAGRSAEEVISTTHRITQAGARTFGEVDPETWHPAAPPDDLARWANAFEQAWTRRWGTKILARAGGRKVLLEAAQDPDRWLTAGPLIPDDVVYTGRHILKIDPARPPEEGLDFLEESPPDKIVVAVTGTGVVFAASSESTLTVMEENLVAHVLVRRLLARQGQARTLPPSEADRLSSMESERYRQKVAGEGRGH